MAFATGDNEFLGNLGNVNYYIRNGKRVARQKRPKNKLQFLTKNSFDPVRKNCDEFGFASKFGTTFRDSFKDWLKYAQDSDMSGRCNKVIREIMNQDTIKPFGQRSIVNGDYNILKGFNFNNNSRLDNIFFYKPFITFDRKNGFVTATLPSFNCKEALNIPKSATHYRIILCCSQIDFIKGKFKNDHAITEATLIETVNPSESFIFSIKKRSGNPIFVALGVQYFQLVNGTYDRVLNKKFNPFAIVEVNY